MARPYEEFFQSPGQRDIAHLYLAAVGVAQRFPTHHAKAVSRLYWEELQALAQVHPMERDSALLGYSGLPSVQDKGILTAMDAGLFLTLGEHLTDRAHLHTGGRVLLPPGG